MDELPRVAITFNSIGAEITINPEGCQNLGDWLYELAESPSGTGVAVTDRFRRRLQAIESLKPVEVDHYVERYFDVDFEAPLSWTAVDNYEVSVYVLDDSELERAVGASTAAG